MDGWTSSRKDTDINVCRLKYHFTSLLSTISFTLYALFPTMSAQLETRWPVERTSRRLQEMSMTSSISSISSHKSETEPSITLQDNDTPAEPSGLREMPTTASESSIRSETGPSVVSQPTDTSTQSNMTEDGSVSGAGESWASEFTSSVEVTPSTVNSELPPATPSTPGIGEKSRSKKELWADLKCQSE